MSVRRKSTKQRPEPLWAENKCESLDLNYLAVKKQLEVQEDKCSFFCGLAIFSSRNRRGWLYASLSPSYFSHFGVPRFCVSA